MVVSVDFYDQFMEYAGDNGIDMDNDTFNIELYNSTHAFTATITIVRIFLQMLLQLISVIQIRDKPSQLRLG